ncbi:MAG: chorismate mutase [Planctomycetota bacterium]|jgi:chorismate mutase/prephenate dehydratase|nr:chorismate mutase [Planctomycetota bacterium]
MGIQETRQAIDQTDREILALLIKRHQLALELGTVKREQGLPIYDALRERDILARLEEASQGRLAIRAVRAVWREIFSASRQAQLPTRVAYLGPEGTFTQQAALFRFGSSADLIPCHTLAAAFALVANESVDYAVLPVENSQHGIVGETVDLLGSAKQPLIVGEIVIPIHLVFSSLAPRLEAVKTIFSKNEAFLQCSTFLDQPSLAGAAHQAVSSTAAAVRQAASDPDSAAISAEIAASQSGVPILHRHVENNSRNRTRFLVLGRHRPLPSGNDKTSVFAHVPNVSGGLEALLRSFREAGINLNKIESRPIDTALNFDAWFYIDMDGHAADPALKEILANHDMIWLGSYPRSEMP